MMRHSVIAVAAIAAAMAAAGRADAAVQNVYAGDSIQTAVNAASPGDTILLHGGTYTQQVIVDKASLTIMAAEPGVIIDATGYGVGIHIIGGGDYTVIDGLEVRNSGYVSGRGAGIGLEYGADHVTIRNTYSHDNTNNGIQSIISTAGQPINNYLLVENCRLEDNGDSGVKVYGSSHVVVQDSVFVNNDDFGVVVWNYRTPAGYVLDDVQILRNQFTNSGDNIKLDGDVKDLTGSVIAYNEISSGTNGIYLRKNVTSAEVYHNTVVSVDNYGLYLRADSLHDYDADLRDNIISGGLYGIYLSNAAGADSDYNDIWGCATAAVYNLTEGSNTIYSDPMFVDAASGDFRLQAGSPALNAGSDGTNMGAWQDQGGEIPEPSGLIVWSLVGALGIAAGRWRRRR